MPVFKSIVLTLSCCLLGACARTTTPPTDGSAEPAREPAQFPAGWRLPTGASSTFAAQAMAVSTSPEASVAAALMVASHI